MCVCVFSIDSGIFGEEQKSWHVSSSNQFLVINLGRIVISSVAIEVVR